MAMENFTCSSHESSKHKEDKKVKSSLLFYYNFLINCMYYEYKKFTPFWV